MIYLASKKAAESEWVQDEIKILLADLNKHNDIVWTAVFSPDSARILTASLDTTAKVWYTPEAIYKWLKTAPIPQLTAEEKKELGID